MKHVIFPRIVQNTLPLAIIVGLTVGAWCWLMNKRNKEMK